MIYREQKLMDSPFPFLPLMDSSEMHFIWLLRWSHMIKESMTTAASNSIIQPSSLPWDHTPQ